MLGVKREFIDEKNNENSNLHKENGVANGT